LARNFLTRSKNASSSAIALELLVGGIGCGRLGTRVGETGGISGAAGFACSILARYVVIRSALESYAPGTEHVCSKSKDGVDR